jgi:glyoxylase-like metal-dependent hydrolase (beta-lactamase superfamily II)
MTPIVHPIKLFMSRAYLVDLDGVLVLIDAGIPGEQQRILRQMRALGYEKLSLIFITHAHIDHYGSASAIREATNAPLAVHRADSEAMSLGETRLGTGRGLGKPIQKIYPAIRRIWKAPATAADIILEDGDDLSQIGVPATVLHTPGHTFGSCSLLVGDSAFVGDLITNRRHRPRLQRYFAEDWQLIRSSFKRLLDTGQKRIYPGHGEYPILTPELTSISSS